MALQDQTHVVNPDVLELAELLRPDWPLIRARIALTGHPTCDGDDDPAGDGDDGAAADDGDQGDDASDGDDDTPITPDDDWQAKARKHERDLKKERKERQRLEAALKERETADLSDHEKALADAREEGKNEALSAAEQERRSDRLEVAVTRLAAKKFEDTEDALTFIERQIARGDLDADDIFDTEGKVNTDALNTALEELLKAKPQLAVTTPGPGKNDAGKGGGSRDPENLGVEGHLKQIQRR